MLYFYSGTPGSGKSLAVAQDIVDKLVKAKQNVITNMYIDYLYVVTNKKKVKKNNRRRKIYNFNFRILNFLSKKILKKELKYNFVEGFLLDQQVGEYFYYKNSEITPKLLVDYAKAYHKIGVEAQTLIVIDEAQLLFSPTVVKLKNQDDKNYRVKWLEFFTQHRRLGYNIILISQFDRLIDAQIRCLFEYNCIHRKANNFKFLWLLNKFNISLFVQVHYWYGINQKNFHQFFTYKPKMAKIYNSYEFLELDI